MPATFRVMWIASHGLGCRAGLRRILLQGCHSRRDLERAKRMGVSRNRTFHVVVDRGLCMASDVSRILWRGPAGARTASRIARAYDRADVRAERVLRGGWLGSAADRLVRVASDGSLRRDRGVRHLARLALLHGGSGPPPGA